MEWYAVEMLVTILLFSTKTFLRLSCTGTPQILCKKFDVKFRSPGGKLDLTRRGLNQGVVTCYSLMPCSLYSMHQPHRPLTTALTASWSNQRTRPVSRDCQSRTHALDLASARDFNLPRDQPFHHRNRQSRLIILQPKAESRHDYSD